MNDTDLRDMAAGGVSPTLNAFDNATETRATVVVTPLAIRGRDGGAQLECGSPDGPYNALRAGDGGSSRSALVCITGDVTHALTSEGHDAGEDGTGRGTPLVPVAFHATQDPIHGDVSPALGANAYIGTHVAAGVRRLTPIECERLMGCPDDWTRYRLDEKKGITVDQADSSRYRQCGNGLVVDVMEWVVGRIQEVAP